MSTTGNSVAQQIAGDGAEAKTRVAAFLEGVGMRPLDAGGLEMAYVLEWAGMLLMGLAPPQPACPELAAA